MTTDAERFNVILADPPWRYDFSNCSGRTVENHYPTMALDEVCALPIASLASQDCVLFLWATSPKLECAFPVIRAWGFEYKTCAVWHKSGLGMGYYFRQDHELLLVAGRGRPGIPPSEARVSSVIQAMKRRHSQKPGVVHQIIERMYPNARRLELFCRSPRPGWYAWGNQAEGAFIVQGQGELEALDLPHGKVLPLDLFAPEAA